MQEQDFIQSQRIDYSSVELHDFEYIASTEKSAIYKAYASKRQKRFPLVIKCIDSHKVAKKKIFEMIMRGNRIHLDLNHPNIVKPYGGFYRRGFYFSMMEHLEGVPLGKIPKITCKALLHVCRNLIKALLYLRENQILHGDIRPSNIFVCNDGTVKLIDFDLCRFIYQKNTGFGGTAYLAPEQLEGRQNLYSDLYSLGVSFLSVLIDGHLPRKNVSTLNTSVLVSGLAESIAENSEKHDCESCIYEKTKACIWTRHIIPGLLNNIPFKRYQAALLIKYESCKNFNLQPVQFAPKYSR